MSSVLSPSVLLPLPGGTVLLPPNARADLAFQTTNLGPYPGGTSGLVTVVDANYIQVLIALSFVYGTADNTAGAPEIFCRSVESSSIAAWTTAGSYLQPEATDATYLFSTGVTSSFVDTAAFTTVVAPLPLLPMFGKQSVEIQFAGTPGHEPGVDNIAATIVYVPTGDIDAGYDTLVATPVLI